MQLTDLEWSSIPFFVITGHCIVQKNHACVQHWTVSELCIIILIKLIVFIIKVSNNSYIYHALSVFVTFVCLYLTTLPKLIMTIRSNLLSLIDLQYTHMHVAFQKLWITITTTWCTREIIIIANVSCITLSYNVRLCYRGIQSVPYRRLGWVGSITCLLIVSLHVAVIIVTIKCIQCW